MKQNQQKAQNPIDLFVKRELPVQKEDTFVPPFELELPTNSAPSLFEVQQLFDDGSDTYVIETAVVIAENPEEAITLLKQDDPDEKRRMFWSDGVTETSSVSVSMVGWATGDAKKGIVSFAGSISE